MQVFTSYGPQQNHTPDVVETSLKVLSVYAMSQGDERRDNEYLLIDAAADCVHDYILGVGKFGPPPPSMRQEVQQVSTSDYQTVASYLEALARASNQGNR